MDPLNKFNSRRSPVFSTKGICASSQPLASSAGIKILNAGGNAADAACAMAAALNVAEPCSTGIGGDAFALYYDAKTKKVSCLMGNGATSKDYSLEYLSSKGYSEASPLPPHSALCVTVPGSAALWEDLIIQHGSKKCSFLDILTPAIELAENGFPVSPVTAKQWSNGILQGDEGMKIFKPNGRTPEPGELFRNPDLACTFRSIAEKGAKEGFYRGRIADAIVASMQQYGGILSHDDLQHHNTLSVDPISCVYKGYRVYETPPPTHGLAVLSALKIIEQLSPSVPSVEDRGACLTGTEGVQPTSKRMKVDSAVTGITHTQRGGEYQAHLGIECMRLAFADVLTHVGDPLVSPVPVDQLLSPPYIKLHAQAVSESSGPALCGDYSAFSQSDTVYFSCVDAQGNGCSMINSNYQGFGTGIVPQGCGFTLQNRGLNFSLRPGHPNQAGPRKRPYHTIIPSILTHESDGSLFCTLGSMGGFMQPQGHFQLIRNLIDFKMNPQEALDAPRWLIEQISKFQVTSKMGASHIKLEHGYGGQYDGGNEHDNGESVMSSLTARGHNVEIVQGFDREVYGRGQIILVHKIDHSSTHSSDSSSHISSGNSKFILQAGSDPRADGCAMPAI